MSGHIRFNDSDDEYQPSNSDDELSESDQKLLQKVRNKGPKYSDSEEEVFGVTNESDDDDDESIGSDIALSDVEGQDADENDGIPDAKAWGKNKKHYYSTDYVDADYGGYQTNDIMQAEIEEQEAINLQNELAKTLDDDDFALDFVTQESNKKDLEANEDSLEDVIKTDVSKLSKRQKLQLLMKESPEFFGLIEDHKKRVAMLTKDILPIVKLYKEGKIQKSNAMDFVNEYHHIVLNYIVNIQMYLLLKANKVPLQTHPIIKRLYQFRQLLSQMDPVFEETIQVQLETLLENIPKNVTIAKKPKKLKLLQSKQTTNESTTKRKRKELEELIPKSILKDKKLDKKKQTVAFAKENQVKQLSESEEEQSTAEYEDTLEDNENLEANDENTKRAITFQMAKNKGLTPKRKKEQRNPRVKHRNKFRKAKIRRKGAVREVRTEMTRYSGEISGIKASVSKSIKIKS